MKKYIASVIGFCAGMGIAFWLFAAAFHMSRLDFWMAALMYLAIGLACSFALSFCVVLIDTTSWLLVSGSVALPTVLMSLLISVGLLIEQKPDWGWVVLAVVTVGCCLIGGRFAVLFRRRSKRRA